MASIKRNALFNISLAVSQVLFPLVTFPYISRVLGPEGVGTVSFIDNYTQYFVLLAALGIPTYGVREISRAGKDRASRSRVFSELLLLHFLAMLFLLLLYMSCFYFVPRLAEYRSLMLAGSTLLVSSTFLIEWLYQGMEQFPFIAIRTIIIRIVAIIAIFLFVHEREDYVLYYAINCGAVAVSAIVNLAYARPMLTGVSIGVLSLRRHLKPLLYIFSTAIVSSVYTLLDTVLLGFLTDNVQVGYYSTSVKLSKIAVMTLAALSAVLVPPLSSAFKEERQGDALQLLNKSFDSSCLLGVPLSIGMFCVADSLILVFSGSAFAPSIASLQILSPTILIVGFSYIYGMQILNPAGYERYFFRATAVGMLLSLCSNLLLIPSLQYIGAALSNLIVESVVLLFLVSYSRHVVAFHPHWQQLFKAVIACLPFFFIVDWIKHLSFVSLHTQLAVMIITCALQYIVVQLMVWRNPLIHGYVERFFTKK
ncbi:flippase [Olivibacter sitiensis]|uniref:flippase n=1 Tax=Olivibacter sitiensis TaxID=376470 RepID=UPI00041625A5|nr:flippase [Olivibacter sitiensis]